MASWPALSPSMVLRRLEADVFPSFGHMFIDNVTAVTEGLARPRKIELSTSGHIAHRAIQIGLLLPLLDRLTWLIGE
jgi:hypothetical protein